MFQFVYADAVRLYKRRDGLDRLWGIVYLALLIEGYQSILAIGPIHYTHANGEILEDGLNRFVVEEFDLRAAVE